MLQESIRIPGSGLHLMYRSSLASGYLSRAVMRLTHSAIPRSLVRVHVRVEIEGSVHTKTYEADPNLTHTFAWNKRNVYKQKVYKYSTSENKIGKSLCLHLLVLYSTLFLSSLSCSILQNSNRSLRK